MVNNLFFPCLCSLSSVGGACCPDFQLLAHGELLSERCLSSLSCEAIVSLSGGLFISRSPQEEQHSGGGQFSRPGFSSHSNFRALSLQGPGCCEGRAADLFSLVPEFPCCPVPSWILLFQGGPRSWAVSLGHFAPGPVLLDSCSWLHSPFLAEPLPETL